MVKKDEIEVKIGSKEEVAWKKIKEQAELALEAALREIEMNRVIAELAQRRVAEEKEKFK